MKAINSWFCFTLTIVYLAAAAYTYITNGPIKDLICFFSLAIFFYLLDIQTGLVNQFKKGK